MSFKKNIVKAAGEFFVSAETAAGLYSDFLLVCEGFVEDFEEERGSFVSFLGGSFE